jgi:DNA-binding PadR family transcriptional regulator
VSKAAITGLGIAVLGLLAERPMHPYEMYQLLLARREQRLVKVRPGSLYHTVDRLVEHGLARAAGTDREGNRPERTVYRLTESGSRMLTERIADLLREPCEEYPAFVLALAEAHNLDRDEVLDLLDSRIARLEHDRVEYTLMRDWGADHRVPRRYWLELDYTRAVLTAQIDWLRSMVSELTSGDLPWPTRDQETGILVPPDNHQPDDVPLPPAAQGRGHTADGIRATAKN